MWVRSKYKMDLVDITGKRINVWESKGYGIYVDPMTTDITCYLGAYETKQRALEILDEIEHLLCTDFKGVYDMPEDIK